MNLSASMFNIRTIIRKELRQLSRDRRSLAVLLALPLFLLITFGYAITLDVKNIALGIYDADKSRHSRQFIQAFSHSEYFNIKTHLENLSDLDRLMGEERIKAAIVIPPDFSRKLLNEENPVIQVIVDGSNASAASTTAGYISGVVADYSRQIMIRSLLKGGSPLLSPPLASRPRIWYNPELRSTLFLIPGLIVLILMVTAVVSTSLSIVREKEKGSLEQLFISPVRPVELLIGKTLPYLFLSLLAAASILLASSALFNLTVRGSLLLLFLVTLIFILGSLGLGILISTIADTQQVAFMVAVLSTILPSFILSGFVFPIRNMPRIIQAITLVSPARYYLACIKEIINKGVGLSVFWVQFVGLVIYSIVILAVSILRMRRMWR
ncbi:MAG TPA: ABC transporter permease [Spirochaetia bacterium]|nr:ABC transporter permease [Spirochaetia bacterium]